MGFFEWFSKLDVITMALILLVTSTVIGAIGIGMSYNIFIRKPMDLRLQLKEKWENERLKIENEKLKMEERKVKLEEKRMELIKKAIDEKNTEALARLTNNNNEES